MSEFACSQMFNNETLVNLIKFTESTSIAAFRLGVYIHGRPTGQVVLSLKDGSTVINTSTFELSHFDSLDTDGVTPLYGTYWHGLIRFDNQAGWQVNVADTDVTLSLEIQLLNHADDANNFFAWKKAVNPYTPTFGENGMPNAGVEYTETEPIYLPHEIEIWKFK